MGWESSAPDQQGRGFPPFSGDTTAWTAESLTKKIAEVIVVSLRDAGLIEWGSSVTLLDHLYVGEQAGGYVRVFLEEAEEDERALFTEALSEVFSPPLNARYVIQRFVDLKEFSIRTRHPWFANVLPALLKKYFAEQYEHIDTERELVMLHAVPAVMAKNKEQSNHFQKTLEQIGQPGRADLYPAWRRARLFDRGGRSRIADDRKSRIERVLPLTLNRWCSTKQVSGVFTSIR